MPRLFTAVELPEDIVDRLARLKTPLPGARWIEPANLHLTLRFMGDIDNRAAREVVDGLAAIDCDPFEVRLAGLGVFGGNDPRAIWAGIEAGPQLEALARANERAARGAGLSPEGRNFKPHVTLARLTHSRDEALAKFLQRNGAFRTEPFLVTRFVLMSSRPHTGGGPYVVEDAFPMGGFPAEPFEQDWQ